MSGSLGGRGDRLSQVEVVRLGGSLLIPGPNENAPPERLRPRLEAWLRNRRGVRVWIAGTGAWGDSLRSLQAPVALDDETCHWAAIDLMSAVATLLQSILPNSELLRDVNDLRRRLDSLSETSADLVFDVGPFLRDVEPTLPGAMLPRDWSVTSDSIAARVAGWIGAGALTLIKSCPPPPTRAPEAWGERELVDSFFARAADHGLELRWVDLSNDSPTERRYPPAS